VCDASGNVSWRFLPQFVTDSVRTVSFDHAGLVSGGKVRAFDHTAPKPPHIRSSSGSITFRFGEAVRGFAGASAVVSDLSGNSIPGTWACSSSSGSVAPCGDGPLRSAVFIADTPGGGTSTAVFCFNPDQHIDVMDMHGNPLLGHQIRQVTY
jgi:hypothetical protein